MGECRIKTKIVQVPEEQIKLVSECKDDFEEKCEVVDIEVPDIECQEALQKECRPVTKKIETETWEEVCKDEFKEVEETAYERVCGQGFTKVEIPYSQRVKRHNHNEAVDSYGAPIAPPHTIDSYGPPAAPLLPPAPQPCQTNDPRPDCRCAPGDTRPHCPPPRPCQVGDLRPQCICLPGDVRAHCQEVCKEVPRVKLVQKKRHICSNVPRIVET